MPSPLILSDAGPLVALFNSRDLGHKWALARFEQFVEPLVTTEAVFSETLHLLRRVPDGARRLLLLWERGWLLLAFSAELEKAALLHLLKRYADIPISLADASLIRLSEIHPACQIWTLDADFRIYRRNGRQAIPLLMPA
ncbi:MAG: type II toxin-antitoxin system VapC family toxin [Chthoniobacterales bacterium]